MSLPMSAPDDGELVTGDGELVTGSWAFVTGEQESVSDADDK